MRKIYVSVVVVFVLFFSAATKLSAQKFEQQFQHDLQILLQEKNSRTPAQQKMDSRLLQAVREKNGQQMAAGVNLLPANVDANSNGDLEIDITANVTDALLTKIEGLGGKIISSVSKFNSIRARVNLSVAETIAGYPEVKFIEPAVKFITEGPGMVTRNKKDRTAVNRPMIFKREEASGFKPFTNLNLFQDRATRVRNQLEKYFDGSGKSTANGMVPFTGAVVSQGDRTHRADDVRNVYGFAGQGIKIGVLSDSYNFLGGAAADIANGDLPGPGNPLGNTTAVTVVQDDGTSDEGRAMLQIVHDVAPKAQLFFATADGGSANFANNILALRNTYGCDIIIDDVFYFNEAVFQDGVIAQAVNTVTAAGALYFSSAGNEGSLAKGTSGYFEGDFNDTGSTVFTTGNAKIGTIQNFGTVGSPLNGDIITSADGDAEGYTLNWSDASGASANDYDLFLISAGGTIKLSSTNIQSGTQNPYEQINPPTLVSGDRLVVFKVTAAATRAISLNTIRGTLAVNTSGQVHGHSAAVNAFSIAATPAVGPGPYPGAFTTSNHVESFSSDGPRRMFYDPTGTPITPGNFLFGTSGGVVRNKPDYTAADGVSTTLPGSSGLNPFYGTSAAAPHAGAIAALLKSANPSLTASQIRTLFTSTALDIESAGNDVNSGNGIIQAFQAMQALAPTPMAVLTLGTTGATEGSFNNGNGIVDPGEIANIQAQLVNFSTVNATAINATLTSITSGISIINGTVSYGTINAGANATNTANPFTVFIGSSVPCGTKITFVLTVNFSGGTSPLTFLFYLTAGAQPYLNISSVLGNTPPTGAGYTSISGQQTGRIARDATTAACGTSKTNPGLTTNVGSRQFDAYTFTNTSSSSQCVTVTLNSSNPANVYSVAYNSSGFVPATPNTNYLADDGIIQAGTHSYSFTVAGSTSFTVVVHDINVTPTSGASYTLGVSLASCSTPPPCTPITITPASIPNGTTGVAYSQSFAATGGSGLYTFAETGALPAGINFSGNTLSGTPTAGGSFPITINVTDAVGCTMGTQNYTLVIGSNVPSTITAIAGTPQATYFGTAFSTALQAVVKDAFNVPVSGVTVTFTAPTVGATGTFTGSVSTINVTTDVNGIATAPTFTANNTLGTYTVTATTGSLTANFSLTNADCVLTCPANVVVSNTAGQCGATVTYTAPTTSGSCGTVTSTPASGSFFPVGTTTVNVSSTTGATCSFTVTVNDTQAPTITCPSNISVPNDANQCGAVVNFSAPTVSDNCPGTTVVSVPASGSFFPGGTTTVTSTATDAHGNTAVCTFTVTVNVPAPVISTQPQAASVCVGSNASFTVAVTGGAVTYQWQVSTNGGSSFSNISGASSSTLSFTNLTVSSSGNQYRVVVTNACGAGSVNSNAVTLTVTPRPTIVINNLPSTICLSDTLVALAATPVGGTWSGIGINGNNFLPYRTAVGKFTLTYTASSNPGCSSSGSATANVIDCPERERLLRDDGVLLYPNPNNGHFNLRVNSTLYNYLGLKVYTSAGVLVKVKAFAGLQYSRVISIDIGDLSAGVYQIEVYYDDGVRTASKNFKVVIAQH